MVKEFIEREKALSNIDKAFKMFQDHNDMLRLYSDTRLAVIVEPAADVAPVRSGRWEKSGSKWQCTNCKVLMSIDGTPQENLLYYCPNCGVLMDKEEPNEL